jgi:hypothetical protein
LKRWPPLGDPALDCRFVALRGPADRLLGTPACRAQQAADMIGTVPDVELFANDRRDALGGPDLPDEAEGFGTQSEQTGKLCELLRAQPGRGPSWRLAVEGFGASFARPL